MRQIAVVLGDAERSMPAVMRNRGAIDRVSRICEESRPKVAQFRLRAGIERPSEIRAELRPLRI
jgi:hypothetical protein